MKRASTGAIVLAAVIAVHAFAQEPKSQQPPRGAEKDWCLLDTSRCEGRTSYPLPEKIERLHRALAQGTAVYTPEELKVLEARLKEAEEYNDLINT